MSEARGSAGQRPVHEATRGVFVPLLLVVATLVLMTGFQSIQLMRARDTLGTRIASQDKPLADSQQVRTQLDAIARDLGKLAAAGNANAKAVVDLLEQRGININLGTPPSKPKSR